jgi:hypothetical protein
MIITTNQVVTQWGTVFGDEVLAAAILDRLLHHSFTLADDPGRELQAQAEAEGGPARQVREGELNPEVEGSIFVT